MIGNDDLDDTFWREYWSLPCHQRADGRHLVRGEAGLRRFCPLYPSDWSKLLVYRRFLKKWGLKGLRNVRG